ncbi:MAG: acyl--CoA ligase [Planctomycetes bacterium]|nr:acyl--CoA ligase [Planctomycetota bacterium]
MTPPFLHLLQESFAKHASRPAVVCNDRAWTYAELGAEIRSVSVVLKAMEVGPGERVAVATVWKLSSLVVPLAAIYVGAVPLPLHPRLTREELRYFLGDSSAIAAISGTIDWARWDTLRAELPSLKHWRTDIGMIGARSDTYQTPTVAASDACLMIYSSGTTGWPKGIVHSHGNVASSLLALQKCWRFTPDDVVLNVLPLFHIHGLAFATLLTLLSGGCVILDDFDPQRTMERIRDCTVFMAVPTIYYRFLEQPNFRDIAKTWTRTRLFTCGSAPIRPEVLPELEAILGKPVINRYGMSEAFVITSLPLDGPWPTGSVGLPLDGVELRIVAREGEAPADPGASAGEPGASATGVGSVQIRGPNLFRGYWRRPAPLTPDPSPPVGRGETEDGWFDTGDLGFLDGAGFLTLVGRKNDLIITSGFNVYPQVVERVINECPGVAESAVLGIPDDRKGERVVAVVVRSDPTLTEDRLRVFLSERLVDYQRPKDIVFVDALPRNTMGKVLRRDLRDQFV